MRSFLLVAISRTGASWRKNPLECSTHAAPAHEPLVLPIKKKGKDGSTKIFANAASLVSSSISLLRSCCGVQLFLDDEDRCSDQCRITRRCCFCSLTTAKWGRSCWWPFRVVGYVILSKHGIQVGRLRTPIWAYLYIIQYISLLLKFYSQMTISFTLLVHQT